MQSCSLSNTKPTCVPKMYDIFRNRFVRIRSLSQYSPKMQSTKPVLSPRVSCPCQYPYFGEKSLALQTPLPLITSTGQVNYSLSPQYAHAWPVVLKDASRAQIHFQNLSLARTKKYSGVIHKEEPRCKICNKTFSRKSSLIVHLRSHSGEKPFKCSHCPKAFAQSANLVAHLRTHTGEKPYACSVCGKCFSQSSSVTTHMRTHTGERPFQCAECGMAFAERSTLSKHQRVHTRKLNPIKAI